MIKNVICSVLVINYLFTGNECALMHLDWDSDRYPFDIKLHRDVLDPDLCEQQLTYLTTDVELLARFLDAGIRFPRGILLGNTIDLGNFHQCLDINEVIEDLVINGKYCRIHIPMGQDLVLPDILDRSLLNVNLSEKTVQQLDVVKRQMITLKKAIGTRDMGISPRVNTSLTNLNIDLAVCIPRPCSTKQALNGLIFNFTEVGFEFIEASCRLPDDRPWATADYVAVFLFSIIGFLTMISTCYDLYQSIFLKKGTKNVSIAYTSFSVYTNTRRLLTFNSSPGSIECVHGIRALATIWAIIVRSFSVISETSNPVELFQWYTSSKAMWVIVSPLIVDTFFLLSGILLVYRIICKSNRMQLLKNLHLFYLQRLLRMFPILAAVVLFKSSFYMRVSDGPLWENVASQVFKCREFWWSTLLHLQNIVNPQETCVGVSWYLAIDIQLYILSPVVLFWVLTSKRAAWTALNTALLATLTASTIYIFYENFPSGIISLNRLEDADRFFKFYYVNILTRASPFLIGMIYGYLLHLWKNKDLEVPKILTTIILLCSLLTMLVVMYCSYIATRLDWDNQLADNFFNSFLRSLWALAVGWMIFACVQGRAEPINWFLSLRIWILPARLSYAMSLVHLSVMVVFYATIPAPIHFTVPSVIFNFMGFLLITVILSFFLTIVIDAPFSTIIKLLLGGYKKSGSDKTSSKHNLANEKYRKADCNYDTDKDVKDNQRSNIIVKNDLRLWKTIFCWLKKNKKLRKSEKKVERPYLV